MPLKEIEMSEGEVHFDTMMSNPGLGVVWGTGHDMHIRYLAAGIKVEEDGNMGRG